MQCSMQCLLFLLMMNWPHIIIGQLIFIFSHMQSTASGLLSFFLHVIEDFERSLRKYIDWYNNKRLKLRLKGMSPAQYRAHYYRELNN